MKALYLLILCAILSYFSPTAAVGSRVVDSSSLDGKVIFGYQGWFGTQNDGNPGYGWRHWSNNPTVVPAGNNVVFDSWPDVTEYPANCMQSVNLHFPNGTQASLFSAFCPGVVDLHFRWMQNYNLDGVMLQRFGVELTDPPGLAERNKVAQSVRKYAERYGRTFSIEYDITGMQESQLFQTITKDWAFLQNTLNITGSPQYQRHNGKPVLVLWGLGFTDRPPADPSAALALISALKATGVYLVGGVPFFWRTGNQDSRPGFNAVYSAYDAINPWAVGRWSTNNQFDGLLKSTIGPDIAQTRARGQAYAPVVWPGFSWANLQRNPSAFNQIPRQCGQFFQHSSSAVAKARPTFIFIAMFDEVNEGTAMFKLASVKSETPVEAQFTYQSLDGCQMTSDAYLVFAQQLKRSFSEILSQ